MFGLLMPWSQLWSQCVVSAGANLYVCSTVAGMDSLDLGQGVLVQYAVPPYTYSWQAHETYVIGSTTYNFHASDYIDDTTIANPRIINNPTDSVQFILTITDSLGCTSSDSLDVVYSFIGTNLAYFTFTINEGDSLYLNYGGNLAGGIAPLHYLWRPQHGLRDSTTLNGFWAKPDSSVSYYLSVTDSVGCLAIGTPFYYITVNPMGTVESNPLRQISMVPNPTDGEFVIKSSVIVDQSVKCVITDVLGCRVKEFVWLPSKDGIFRGSMSGFAAGVYFMTFNTSQSSLGRLRVVKY